MANEVSIVIRARNFATKVLGKVTMQVKRMGRFLRGAGQIGRRVFSSFTRVAAAASAAIGAVVMHANRFRQEMALVDTMLAQGSKSLRGFTKDVIRLSAELGIAKDTLAKGLYQVLSAGVPEGNALEFLAVAAKAAVGGATDVETAVDGLTTVLNAYGLEAKEVTHISDLMFTVVRDGKTTYAQLAENIAKVAPIAKVAGVTIEDLSATIAALVKVEKPERAMTALTAAMVEAAKRGQSLFEMLNDFEGASFEDIIGAGITKRAAAGVALLSGNMEVLRKEMKRFGNVAGAATEAFDKMDNVRHWQKLLQSVLANITEFGLVLDNFLGPKVDAISDRIKQLRSEAEALAQILIEGGDARANLGAAFANLFKSALVVASEKAAIILKRAAPVIGRLIGDAFKAAATSFGRGKGTRSVARDIVQTEMAKEMGISKGGVRTSVASNGRLDEYNRRIDETQAKLERLEDKRIAANIDISGLTAAEVSLRDALATIHDIAKTRAEQNSTEESITANSNDQLDTVQQIGNQVQKELAVDKEREKLLERRAELMGKIAKDAAKAADVAPLQKELEGINAELERVEENLAKADEARAKFDKPGAFKEFLEGRRGAAQGEKDAEARAKREADIREKLEKRRGDVSQLSKRDQEFLSEIDAFREAENKAQLQFQKADAERLRLEAKREEAQRLLQKATDDQLRELKSINKLLDSNLKAPKV